MQVFSLSSVPNWIGFHAGATFLSILFLNLLLLDESFHSFQRLVDEALVFVLKRKDPKTDVIFFRDHNHDFTVDNGESSACLYIYMLTFHSFSSRVQ